MPDVRIGLDQRAVNTFTGLQSFTAALNGATPKASLHFLTSGTVAGSLAPHAMLVIGAAQGAGQANVSVFDTDNISPSNARKRDSSTELIAPRNAPGQDGAAQLDAFIADGVRVDWTVAPSAGYLLTSVFFAGTDLQAVLGSVVLNTVDVAVTANIGFAADVLIVFSAHRAANGDNALFEYALGVAHRDGTRRAISQRAPSNQTVGNQRTWLSDQYAALKTQGPNPVYGVEVSNFTATTVDFTPRLGAAGLDTVRYLALEFATLSSKVGDLTTPTVVGDMAVAGVGFTPQFVLAGLTGDTLLNAAVEGGEAGYSLATAAAEFSLAVAQERFANPHNTQSLSANQAWHKPRQSGVADIVGTLQSFDADGFTYDLTTVGAAARGGWYLAIESVPAPVTLAVQSAEHGQVVASPQLTQANMLAMQDALHGHSAASLDLAQAHVLAVADVSHGHSAASLTLSEAAALAIEDAAHAHLVDNVALVQAHTLAVQEALHAHGADNITISVSTLLAVADALHAHGADDVVLSQAGVLVVAGALHGHSAENLALVQAHLLAVAGANHDHLADEFALISDSLLLAVADAVHAHTAADLVLTATQVLIVSSSLHQQLAEQVTLQLGGFVNDPARVFVVEPDNRTSTARAETRTFVVARGRRTFNA